MAAHCVAPQLEPPVEKKPLQACEPKQVAPKKPSRDLLAKIFQGHEDFLGWTPD